MANEVDRIFTDIEMAERIAAGIAEFFGLDQAEVLRVAKTTIPDLASAAPDEAAAYLDARKRVLGDERK